MYKSISVKENEPIINSSIKNKYQDKDFSNCKWTGGELDSDLVNTEICGLATADVWNENNNCWNYYPLYLLFIPSVFIPQELIFMVLFSLNLCWFDRKFSLNTQESRERGNPFISILYFFNIDETVNFWNKDHLRSEHRIQ